MEIFGENRHSIVCSDPLLRKLFWIAPDGTCTKELPVAGCCFDVWALPDGRILYPHYGVGTDGVSIVDEEGTLHFRYETTGEVFGCQPLENGHILVGELRPKRLTEVTPQGTIAKEIPLHYEGDPHECMRMPRKVKDGYLVVQPGLRQILRLDPNGEPVCRYHTHEDTFGVVELDNGHLVYTCMKGAFELDREGREVWSLTDEDVPDIHIRWLLGIQLRANGNLVLCNWLGHGHHGEGVPFFEVMRDKRVVWMCDCRNELPEVACMQLLDEEKETVCYRPCR